ncbi:hypothetical protein FKM82_018230 [Ascaphus truei]
MLSFWLNPSYYSLLSSPVSWSRQLSVFKYFVDVGLRNSETCAVSVCSAELFSLFLLGSLMIMTPSWDHTSSPHVMVPDTNRDCMRDPVPWAAHCWYRTSC